MSIKNQRDFWAGLMFLIVGIAFAWGSTNYSFGTSARPGPGYFPFGLGILLGLLGAFEVFKSVTFEPPEGSEIGRWAWRPLGFVVLAVVVFGFTLPKLGLALSLPLLILISSLAGDTFRWRDVLLASVVLTVGSWAVFNKGLNLVIPVWPTFFG